MKFMSASCVYGQVTAMNACFFADCNSVMQQMAAVAVLLCEKRVILTSAVLSQNTRVIERHTKDDRQTDNIT